MMKNLLFFLLCCFTIGVVNAQDVNLPALDSTYTYDYDAATSDFILEYKIVYEYNYQRKMTKAELFSWDAPTNTFVPQEIITRNYTSNGLVSEYLLSGWDASLNDYIPFARTTYQYNTDNLITLSIDQFYDDISGTYDNDRQQEYTYIGDILYRKTTYSWHSATDVWRPTQRTTYTAGANELPSTELTQTYNTTSSTWVSFQRIIYEYNSNDDETLTEYSSWNTTTSSWVNTVKIETSHNALFQEEQLIVYNWDAVSNDWILFRLTQHEYNSLDKLVSTTNSEFDLVVLNLIEDDRVLYSYDSNGNQTKTENETWNTAINAWEASITNEIDYTNLAYPESILPIEISSLFNVDEGNQNLPESVVRYDYTVGLNPDRKGEYFYSNKLVTSIRNTENNLISIYPNPASNQITVEVADLNNPSIRLFNTVGQLVLNESLTNTTLDISSLQQGLYFYNIEENGTLLGKGKLLKQ